MKVIEQPYYGEYSVYIENVDLSRFFLEFSYFMTASSFASQTLQSME